MFLGEVLGQRVTLPQSFLIPKLEVDQINPFSLRTREIIYYFSIPMQDEWHNWSRESYCEICFVNTWHSIQENTLIKHVSEVICSRCYIFSLRIALGLKYELPNIC